MKQESIIIYCDGACSGNQFSRNKGGWGAVLKYKNKIKEIHGGERDTTNQRMELTACIQALEHMKKPDIPIEIYSDSAYLINCMQQRWYQKWKKTGWKNARKKDVENRDLWEHLLKQLGRYEVSFHKVAGHRGVELNERADQLAQDGISELQ